MLIGTSNLERIVIRSIIWALRSISPLSFLHVFATTLVPQYPLRPFLVLTAYASIECTFYLFVYLPRKRHLQKPTVHPPRMPQPERRALMLRCHENIADPEAFFDGWYLPSISSDKTIRRENVVEWILWGLFSAGPEALSEPGVEEEVEEYMEMYEKVLGKKIPPGRNPDLKSIRLTMDEVVIYHRPFLWYLIVLGVDTFVTTWLLRSGFKHYTTSQSIFPPRPDSLFSNRSPSKLLSYWYRPASPQLPLTTDHYPPLLFLHGIGIGLLPYVAMLNGYSKKHLDTPIIVPEILSISFRLTRSPLSQEEFGESLVEIFNFHNIRDYAVVGHSYGTALAAGLIRATMPPPKSPTPSTPSTTSAVVHDSPPSSPTSLALLKLPPPSSITLLDPIPILLHLPSVARNFLYRPPHHGNEHELYYFACTDPGVAHSLARHFFWTNIILWREDLARIGHTHTNEEVLSPRVAIVLSGSDIIVDAPAVWTYLTGLPVPTNDCIPPRPFVPPVPHKDALVPVVCKPSPNVVAAYLGGLDHAQMFLTQESWKGLIEIVESVSVIKDSD
ncbi:hypothetical protein BDV93DRAFT_528420, partial [Ceratobasidium sp. AG-I]